MKTYLIGLMIACCAMFTIHANDYDFSDPYPEVYHTTEPLPYFCHGWTTYEHIFAPLLAEKRFKTVIEIGVFLGKLTKFIAPRLPFGSKYFAVDHWKGSIEHMVPGTIENECLKNMYQQFLSNMIHLDLTDTVIPVRMDSLSAAKKFMALNIKADLIYIDAAHDFVSVYRDLNAWFPILAENGMFCGDDWHYGGVQTAVKHFAAQKGLPLHVDGNFWHLQTTTHLTEEFSCTLDQ